MYAQIMIHHDYVWARTPFLAPMAATIARRRPSAAFVAHRLDGLAKLLFGHLREEERLLVGDASAAVTLIGNGMIDDHLMIATALDEIRDAVARWTHPSVLEQRLGNELAALDEHIQAQFALEEMYVAARIGAREYA